MMRQVWYLIKPGSTNLICLIKGHLLCRIYCRVTKACGRRDRAHCPRCGALTGYLKQERVTNKFPEVLIDGDGYES